MQLLKKPRHENLCVPKIICDFIKTCTYLGTFYKTQKKAFKVLRYVRYMGPFFSKQSEIKGFTYNSLFTVVFPTI